MKRSWPQNIISPLSIETPVSDYSCFHLCCVFLNEEPQARFSPAVCDGSGLENIHFHNLCVSDKPSGGIVVTLSGWWWEAICSYWCSKYKYRNQEKDNSPSAPKTVLIETSALKWVGVTFQIELWAYICCSLRTLNCANPLTRFELVSDPMETDAHLLITHLADCSLVLIGHGHDWSNSPPVGGKLHL